VNASVPCSKCSAFSRFRRKRIVIKGTPDQLALASKMIDDIDKSKPEVIVRRVGGTGTARQNSQPGHYPSAESDSDPARHQYHEHRHWHRTTTTSTGTGLNFNDLQHLNSTNYAVTIDQVKAVALFSDADTKIMQNRRSAPRQ